MLKSELLELIRDIEEEGVIDEKLSSIGFAKPLKFKDKNVMTDKDLLHLIDSERDKGIEGFKKNGMLKIIEQEVAKRTDNSETPEQKRIRELEERLDKADKDKQYAEMTARYKDILSEKKIPSNLINMMLGEDDEKTDENIKIFENSMKSYIDNQVQERLNGGYKPPIEETGKTNNTYESLLKNDNLSMEEALEYFGNNNN